MPYPWLLILFFACLIPLKAQRVIVSAMGTDSEYRVTLASQVLGQVSHERHTGLTSGKSILEALRGDLIRLWVHFAHGSAKRIYGNSAARGISYLNAGLTATRNSSPYDAPECRSLDDLQEEIEAFQNIEFATGATIYLGACWIGTPDQSGIVLAQRLANITGATVIAGRERTEPLRENSRTLRYTNNAHFFKFLPFREPEDLGKDFDLSVLLGSTDGAQGEQK
ncbi:MAG: hypothetical protein ACFCUI_07060 [Bernardetiaceae bacterium]